MLGPVEDMLAEPDEPPAPRHRERLEIAHRNALRLHKLVNTLLDFSRIEAGRVKASFEPIDLGAVHRGTGQQLPLGLRAGGPGPRVDCPPLPEPVYVDRDMWEKIVLNLLSNAFKFTLEGGIEVALRPAGGQVELAVRDTGTGIPAEELPRLFERFHRVEDDAGPHAGGYGHRPGPGPGTGPAPRRRGPGRERRTARGSDVHRHGPAGHGAPARRPDRGARTLASTALGRPPYVEEVLRWLPDERGRGPGRRGPPAAANAPEPADRRAGRRGRAAGRASCWPTTTPTCGITSAGCWPTATR